MVKFDMKLPNQIPVFILSGFLGSGKSTLLNELLNENAFKDSAIIINEFGDIPVDHFLIRTGETSISQVSTGCLCCSGSTDLRATLFDLHCAAEAGLCPPFSRIIIEMSGLGDPAPIVNSLMPRITPLETLRDKTIENVFHLAGFVTLYDIITGPISLENHFEALKQIAFADKILLTKTDLAHDPATLKDVEALPSELSQLNASADIIDKKQVNLLELFSPRPYMEVEFGDDVTGWLAIEAAMASEAIKHEASDNRNFNVNRHGEGIRTSSITSSAPISEEQFNKFMWVLQNAAGPRLLRMKGIVAIAEDVSRPRIVHVVQHMTASPLILDKWPSEDHTTQLVFITNGIDPEPIKTLFDAAIKDPSKSSSIILKQLTNLFLKTLTRLGNVMSPNSRRTP
jgi:G3E family GTPase